MKPVSLEEVMFFFDAAQQDAVDKGTLSARYADLLELREKLLRLPAADYGPVIEAIRSLIEAKTNRAETKPKNAQKSKSSLELYDRTKEVTAASVEKISAI